MPAWIIPAAIGAASALYSATRKQPKTPQYKPSQWEQDYYKRLEGILGGTDPSFSTEGQYQLAKDKLLPEYERLRKEGNINLARRGIEGGPEIGFERKLGENQLRDLTNLRRQIEGDLRNLKLLALRGMGQLGQGRSQAEYSQQMADFQARMQQYQQMQESMTGLIDVGGQMAYGMYGNQPQRTYSQFPIQQRYTYTPIGSR